MKLLTNFGQLDEQNVDQLLTQAEEEGKNQQELTKAQAVENEQRKREQLIKTQGPFIGPRGGKWADPAHTIPWVEGRSEGGIKKQLATVQADLKQTKAALERAKQQGNPRLIKLFGDRLGQLEYAIEKMQTKLSGKPKVKPAESKPKATTKKVPASQQKAIDALKQGGLKMSKLKAAGVTKTQINSAVKAGLAWKGPDGAYRLTSMGDKLVSKAFAELDDFLTKAKGPIATGKRGGKIYGYDAKGNPIYSPGKEEKPIDQEMLWQGLDAVREMKDVSKHASRAMITDMVSIFDFKRQDEFMNALKFLNQPNVVKPFLESITQKELKRMLKIAKRIEKRPKSVDNYRGADLQGIRDVAQSVVDFFEDAAKGSVQPIKKSFSEEPMDGIDMLQELTKAKYKRRWKGKDGKWQYEYDEPKKERKTDRNRIEGGYGTVYQYALPNGNKIVIRAIWQAHKGDSYHVRVENKEGKAVRGKRDDVYLARHEGDQKAALREALKIAQGWGGGSIEEGVKQAQEKQKKVDESWGRSTKTEKSLEKAQTIPEGNPKQGLGQGAEQGGKLAAVGKQSGSNDAKGGSPGASKPKSQVLSEDEEEDEANMKTHKKPIEKIRKSVPGGTTPTGQREMVAHQHAAHVSQLQKGEDDVRVGVGLRGPQNEPETLTEPKHWVGHANVIHFTNASDQATTNLLEKAHDSGLVIHTPNITRNSVLDKDSKHCAACRAVLAKSLAQCPTCGTDQSMEIPDHSVQFQDNYRGQGLRPAIIPDLILPNGIANED